MLDHVTIGVSNTGQSKKFYDQALRPLGIARLYGDGERFAGYGIGPRPSSGSGYETPRRPGRISPSRHRIGRP
jgi:catechol 2,3-dioxygenase-like lactoylglutathione lyase family enzyme